MKRILGTAAALAFVIAAYAVYAQTAAPKSTAVPAVPPVLAAPEASEAKAADPKDDATLTCKKKGLAGEALDECVRNEILKSETSAAPANTKDEGRGTKDVKTGNR